MGDEADIFKYAEIRALVLGRDGGSPSKPIRKRGFHRALKRGELWAVLQHQTNQIMNQMAAQMFEIILAPSPLFQMTGLSELVKVPIKYGK